MQPEEALGRLRRLGVVTHDEARRGYRALSLPSALARLRTRGVAEDGQQHAQRDESVESGRSGGAGGAHGGATGERERPGGRFGGYAPFLEMLTTPRGTQLLRERSH